MDASAVPNDSQDAPEKPKYQPPPSRSSTLNMNLDANRMPVKDFSKPEIEGEKMSEADLLCELDDPQCIEDVLEEMKDVDLETFDQDTSTSTDDKLS